MMDPAIHLHFYAFLLSFEIKYKRNGHVFRLGLRIKPKVDSTFTWLWQIYSPINMLTLYVAIFDNILIPSSLNKQLMY